MSQIVAKELARISAAVGEYMLKRVFIEDYRGGWAEHGSPEHRAYRAGKSGNFVGHTQLRRMCRTIAKKELKIPFIHGTMSYIIHGNSKPKPGEQHPMLYLQVPKHKNLNALHAFLDMGAVPSNYGYSRLRGPERTSNHNAKSFSTYRLCGDEHIDGFWNYMARPELKEMLKL